MQDHRFDFVVGGTPDEVWDIMWTTTRRGVDTPTYRIEVLHQGDAAGNGLVRHCTFPVPRYLLSGGRGQSWEWITESVPPVSWRYDAIGKPLWSRASGWTRLEDIGEGRTRVHFRETYEAFNPVVRALLEARVHRFISRDNDTAIEAAIVRSLERRRRRAAEAAADGQRDGS